MRQRKKLGELLCEKSYLDESGLKFALAEQKIEHRKLGQILLDLGYITQAQLNEALAHQAGIYKVDLTNLSMSNEIITLVPAELVSKYNAHSSSLFINEVKGETENFEEIPGIWTKLYREDAFTDLVKTSIEEHLGNI